jgi:hypothetical protein
MLTDAHIDAVLESTGAFIECIQGETLEPYMEKVCDLIDQGKNKIAISACHAVGKTHGLSCITDALMTINKEIKIITTAPTFRQVELLLWKEIKSRYSSKPSDWQFGKLTTVRWDIDSETFAVGFSPSKEAGVGTGQSKQSPFQGFHAKNLTVVIFDEATGVPPQIWKEAEGLLTTSRTLWICIGNPTARNTDFYKCFQSPVWTKVNITCFDTPNFKANGILCLEHMLEERDILVDLLENDGQVAFMDRLDSYIVVKEHLIVVKWAMEKLIEWGEDHPLFQGKVLGQFPDEDENVLIPEKVVKMAQEREYEIKDNDMVYIGVDVARYGSDSTVFTEIIGWKQTRLKVMNKKDGMEAVSMFRDFVLEGGYYGERKIKVAIDSGYGQGVIDPLMMMTGQKEKNKDNELFWGLHGTFADKIEVMEINFGGTNWVRWHYGWKDEKAIRDENLHVDRKVQEDGENFANFKAKMFDKLAMDLKTRLALLPDKVYINSLPTIILLPGGDSKMQIESKKDYKARTGEGSPDEADSLALANLARYFAAKPLGVLEAMEESRGNE